MKTTFEGMEIETGCEMVDVTSNHRPDPSWRFVDAAGHEHRWIVDGEPATSYSPQKTYEIPTIRWHRDEPFITEDGDEVEVGHSECVDCGAHVVPGYTADTNRVFAPGLRWFKINGRDATEEEVRELQRKFESTHRSGS